MRISKLVYHWRHCLHFCVWPTEKYEDLSSSDESCPVPQRQRPCRKKGLSIHEGPRALARITAIGLGGKTQPSCYGEHSTCPDGFLIVLSRILSEWEGTTLRLLKCGPLGRSNSSKTQNQWQWWKYIRQWLDLGFAFILWFVFSLVKIVNNSSRNRASSDFIHHIVS